jgi:hypothetical protein
MAWTCQRQAGGITCKHVNPNRKRKCEACGKTRPPRPRPAHLVALDEEYGAYIVRTGGEFCALCGALPPEGRKLHRDHDHATGRGRALLCFRCNTALPNRVTPDWLRKAADYIERFSGLA